MTYKVYIPQDIAEEGKDVLRKQGYELILGQELTLESMKKAVADCDAVLLRTAEFGRELLEAGKKLKIVARHGAGYDNVDCEAAAKLGIWVTNSPFTTGLSVAECTIGAMLTLAKRYRECERELRLDNFRYKFSHKGMDLEGKTLGIIGFGQIGQRVAKKAALGLDMKVCTVKREGKEYPDYVTLLDDLDSLLQSSDFVSIHVPGGAKTKDMICARELARMKPTAYLLDFARGGIVNEAALCEAVSKGTIAGAAVDVFTEEPPRPENPLFTLEHVMLTPHMGSNTEECMIRIAVDAAEEIVRVLSGEKPEHPVNQPVGLDRSLRNPASEAPVS